jgi:hypothetical protein
MREGLSKQDRSGYRPAKRRLQGRVLKRDRKQMAKIEIPLRAVIEAPPPGVQWAFQRSRGDCSDLATPTKSSAERLVFDFTIQAERADDGVLRLLGPGVQGPPTARFFYLNSGTLAGDTSSCFSRRAKVSLMGLTWPQIEALGPGQRLQVRIAGTGKGGGPACASITPLPPGWSVV